MSKRCQFFIIFSLLFSPLFIQSTYALDCAVISRESVAGTAGTILEAQVVAVYYEDGTPYAPDGEWREDAVLMQVEVSRVWRGRASEKEVIRFSDPEWGGVPPIGVDKIYYMGRQNGLLSTGNCARLVAANDDERGYLDAIYGEGESVAPGPSEEHTELDSLIEGAVTQEETAPTGRVDSNLQPIVVGPVSAETNSNWLKATFPFNLLCLVLLLSAFVILYFLRRRPQKEKSVSG